MLPQKKRVLKLSRQEKLKKSPIPWVALIIVSLIAIALFYSTIVEWNHQRGSLKTLAAENEALESDKKTKQEALKELEILFQKEAGKQLELEAQLIPKKVDTGKIVQVLETQLLNIDTRLKIISINFSGTVEDPNGEYQFTRVNIDLLTPKSQIKDIIQMIQGKKDEVGSNLEFEDEFFLEGNKLPLGAIDSLSITQAESDSGQELYQVQMRVKFFAQIPEDN